MSRHGCFDIKKNNVINQLIDIDEPALPTFSRSAEKKKSWPRHFVDKPTIEFWAFLSSHRQRSSYCSRSTKKTSVHLLVSKFQKLLYILSKYFMIYEVGPYWKLILMFAFFYASRPHKVHGVTLNREFWDLELFFLGRMRWQKLNYFVIKKISLFRL